MNEALVAFYAGTGTDNKGRTLGQFLAWDNLKWERTHDHIQWLFPLPEPSKHNAQAPLLDAETVEVFKKDKRIRENMTAALQRATEFLFRGDPPPWFTSTNHNLLRITRILRCLTLCGFYEEARDLYSNLVGLVTSYPEVISQGTLDFWAEAINP